MTVSIVERVFSLLASGGNGRHGAEHGPMRRNFTREVAYGYEVNHVHVVLVRAADGRTLSCGAEQLKPFVPDEPDCEQLGYGQGEGAIRIGNSTWGVYVSDDFNGYSVVLHEGALSIDEFFRALSRIRASLEGHFRCAIELWFVGDRSGLPEVFSSQPYR